MRDLQCCPDGGEKKLDGTFKTEGEIIELDNMRVYSVGEGDNVLIIAHDIFGFDGGRTKVVCDHFSQNNLKIYMPDFFRTQWFDPYDTSKSQTDLGNFIQQFPPEKLHSDLYDRLLPFIKKNQKIESLGIAGFCWGAIPVFMACKDIKFNYGISYHPSLRLLSFFDIDPIKFGNQIKSPQFIALSKQEHDYYRKGGELNEILGKSLGDDFELWDYQQMNHGFVCRGELSNQLIEKSYQDVMFKTFKFINRVLKKK